MEILTLSQRDPRWSGRRLGNCTDTIGQSGCALTCVAMLLGINPDVANDQVIYFNGCLMDWANTAHKFGMKYSGVTDRAVFFPCIAEVKLYNSQHFVVLDAGGNQYDPWTGKVGKNTYPIKSYRNISPNTPVASLNIDKGALVMALGRMIGIEYSEADTGYKGHLANPDLDSMLKGFFDAQSTQITDKIINFVISLKDRR